MNILHRTLYGCYSYTKQSSLRHSSNFRLIAFVERQQILELESIPWLFVVLALSKTYAEHASMTNRRSDYEDA